jgi:hypothetical protein
MILFLTILLVILSIAGIFFLPTLIAKIKTVFNRSIADRDEL